jgi:autophagy-related protein 13
MGTLALSVTYLTTPNFQLDDLESLLSSRFLSLDTGPEFTPTLAKNQQRDSFSRGSLPARMPLPQKSSSPPSNVADRFVLPSRVASLGLSPRNAPLPLERSSSANAAESKEDSRSPSGLAARLRKESLVLTSGSVSFYTRSRQ